MKNGSKQPSHWYNTPHFAHWWLHACSIAIFFNGSLQRWNCYGLGSISSPLMIQWPMVELEAYTTIFW